MFVLKNEINETKSVVNFKNKTENKNYKDEFIHLN